MSRPLTFENPGQTCPGCGAKADATTTVTGRRAPQPGDVLVCYYCAEVLQVGGDGLWQLCTDEATRSDPTVTGIRAAVITRGEVS